MKEPRLGPEQRFDRIFAMAVRDGRRGELATDMGDPRTVGEARLVFVGLRDFDGRKNLDRSVLELKYGDEIT